MKHQKMVAYFQLTIAQFGIALGIIFSKELMNLGFAPSIVVASRFIISVLALGTILILGATDSTKRHALFHWKFKASDMPLLLFQALCGGIFFNVLLNLGLKFTTAKTAGLLTSALPAVLAFMAWIFLREKISHEKKFAILVVILGVAILELDAFKNGPDHGMVLGGIFVILALIPEASYTIITRRFRGYCHPLMLAFFVNVINAIAFLPFYAPTILSDMQKLNPNGYICFALSGLGSILFYVYWNQGMTQVKASTAALFTAVEPVSTAILAVFFFGEIFSFTDGVATALVLSSIFMGITPNKKKTGNHNAYNSGSTVVDSELLL